MGQNIQAIRQERGNVAEKIRAGKGNAVGLFLGGVVNLFALMPSPRREMERLHPVYSQPAMAGIVPSRQIWHLFCSS